MKMAFLPCQQDGCALYRCFIPHLNIKGSKFVYKVGALPFAEFSDVDVVVVQRQASDQNLAALKQLKAVGLKLIYDTDDDLWSLPSANPGKQIFKAMQDGFSRCALVCDLITVSTRGLQSAVRSNVPGFKGEILICPNAMDFNLFGPSEVTKDDDRIVIGWAGSNTHDEDVQDAWAALPRIIDEFPNVYLDVIGMPPPKKLWGHPRVKMKRFVPVGEYPSRLSSWGWDITLAPIDDNRFNRSKSNVKCLEAAALTIPILVSDVRPYEEFCSLGDLSWIKCTLPSHWYTKLRDLVVDAALRKTQAERVRMVAEKWFNASTLNRNWIHAGEMVCQR